MPPPATTSNEVPLCVDLDGTLIKTDLTWEFLVCLLRRNPLYLLVVPFWLLRGRAFLKKALAERCEIDASALPYCESLLAYVREQKKSGRRVLLVTASDRRMAEPVAAYLGCFDEVLASDGQTNLRGHNKTTELVRRFQREGFDYAGNSSVDYPVWEAARQAIVVNARRRVSSRAHRRTRVSQVFEPATGFWRHLLHTLRPHQWVKNFIIFVPLIAAHRLTEWSLGASAVTAFLAFSFCASAVYVINDLVDLGPDRHHLRKRARPFASGKLPIPVGFIAVPVLLLAATTLAVNLAGTFSLALLGYLVLTTAYSLWIKQIPLVDVFCLAGLYTIRLVAGHEATGVAYSFWLLLFSIFIFLSLALVKRYVELRGLSADEPDLKGRGYAAQDLAVVLSVGTSSGFAAVLVLALYVNSPDVQILYHHPLVLLLICPLLLFWISRTWMLAHRGRVHDDPIVFAIRDPVSYAIGLLCLVTLWLASAPWAAH